MFFGRNKEIDTTIVKDNSKDILDLEMKIHEIIDKDLLDNKYSLFRFDIVKDYLRKT